MRTNKILEETNSELTSCQKVIYVLMKIVFLTSIIYLKSLLRDNNELSATRKQTHENISLQSFLVYTANLLQHSILRSSNFVDYFLNLD